jgi:predicted outer membrane repeat protein
MFGIGNGGALFVEGNAFFYLYSDVFFNCSGVKGGAIYSSSDKSGEGYLSFC